MYPAQTIKKLYIFLKWIVEAARFYRSHMQGISTGVIALVFLMPIISVAAPDQDNGRYHRTLDILDAVYLPDLHEVLVVGHYGLIGLLKIENGRVIVKTLYNIPKTDFESVVRLSDNMVLLGGSTGQIFLFNHQSEELIKVAGLSDFNEPVLDISVGGNSIWAVGSRGLIARSVNGKEWQKVEISRIRQPVMRLPSGKAGTYYLGAANIDPESFLLEARVKGKAPVPDVDYVLFPEEGTLRIDNTFDSNAPATVSFVFSPGPPFGSGDVSWNLVLQENGRITLAGEFGLVIQSNDQGQSWSSRNGSITDFEPEQSYWMAGAAQGNRVLLVGAAGVIMSSSDSGDTWEKLSKPGKEAIFNVSFMDDGKPVIAGAVGLLGTFKDAKWTLVDRTKLDLMSWVRAFVDLENGGMLLLGGRSTSLLYQDHQWKRLELVIEEERP